MKRTAILIACIAMMATGVHAAGKKTDYDRSGDRLTGFVVSDSHFGSLSAEQPSPEQQRAAMKTIMDRFPDLDVFIDTGDAHQDYATDRALGDWTDIIQGGCRTVPFFFVPGNNDGSWTAGQGADAEQRTAAMANIECQPYYSFDLKGIHFVALPEVMGATLLSYAELAWLRLDLDVNQDKTTIILSHNALAGTTSNFGQPGYRQVAGSDAIFTILKKYPNVLAWMHGHNHTYQIVPLDNRLYVGCGRMGGHDLSDKKIYAGNYGAGNLGGVWFELSPEALTVRCFSATQGKFFDEMPAGEAMSYTLRRPTTIDARELPAVSYGVGNAIDGLRTSAWHHTVGGFRKLYFTGSETQVINEDPTFKYCSFRGASPGGDKWLPAYCFEPAAEPDSLGADNTWQWLNPGVRIAKRAHRGETKAIFTPNATSQGSYYRCTPGQTYKLTVQFESKGGGQTVTPELRLTERHGVLMLRDTLRTMTLRNGHSELVWEDDIPDLGQVASIFTDPASDNCYQLCAGLVFSNLKADVDVTSIRLTLSGAANSGSVINPMIFVDGQRIALQEEVRHGVVKSMDVRMPMPARSVYAIGAEGNRQLTWLETQGGVHFQVRGAAACYRDGLLTLGPMTNLFSPRNEMVIVPMMKTSLPYVHRLRQVASATIKEASTISFQSGAMSAVPEPSKPVDPELTITISRIIVPDMAEIDIVCAEKPIKVEGAKDYRYSDGMLTMKVAAGHTYKLTWPSQSEK